MFYKVKLKEEDTGRCIKNHLKVGLWLVTNEEAFGIAD